MKAAGLNTLQTKNDTMKLPWSFLIAVILLPTIFTGTARKSKKRKKCTLRRSFKIASKGDQFLKDGKPFRFISGDMHYFRITRCHWRDRFTKIKYAGLNAVATYVAWNMHEAQEGKYDFEGNNDLVGFIQMAQSVGLLVIVRAGPYICAEWDLVENEYGSYFTCDHQYMSHLQEVFEQHLGKDVILFTNDGANDKMLECGSLPSLFTTVDFGPGVDPAVPFNLLRKYQPNGPLVNSEFYPGWLDHWAEQHQTRNAAEFAIYLDKILALNASVNMYMFEGGTNFGFMNGANGYQDSRVFQPQPTSYDYDAPLTEAGDPTTKYFVIMETIAKYTTVPPGPVPPPTQKFAYGKVNMTKISSIFDALHFLTRSGPVSRNDTLSMEQIGQNYGFILYRTIIPVSGPAADLGIPGLRDRGIVFVNQVRQATLIRVGGKTNATIEVKEGATLDILVENMGRVNYGPHLQDPKGILGNVTLNGAVLRNWTIYPLHLDDFVGRKKSSLIKLKSKSSVQIPSFYHGNIPPAPEGIPMDTFLKLPGWFKGQAFVNGFNIGRYWPVVGPQITLYVPASILNSGKEVTEVVLLELDNAPCEDPKGCFVDFVETPVIDGPVRPMTSKQILPDAVYDDWTAKYKDFLPSYVKTKKQVLDILSSRL
ncbi:unnamed protein product [Pocillopora meandrina]|uniref:Beta-galactosidase n=1 Tax=Pocillopora meandrina TaxID=46732 RepID=A0AAU9WSN0_9CNID|nr:unnamed protein product [Pocillopora meandrina]